jgi:hypothetical protein
MNRRKVDDLRSLFRVIFYESPIKHKNGLFAFNSGIISISGYKGGGTH